MNLLKYFVLALLLLPATSALATANLTSSPVGPYGPFYVGQMPIFYYNLNNTGTTDTGTQRPLMNSNWAAVDMYSNNNYPSGKGPEGGWQWVSGDGFGPVPAGGTLVVNNGGPGSTPRWPDNDYCMGATGNHRVMMYVDSGNDVPETNNSDNNSIWSSFTVVNRPTPAPDMTTAPSLTPLGPYVQNQTASIPFRFFNTGTLVATATLKARAQIYFYNDGTANDAVTLGGAGRPILALGENRIENFYWPATTPGTHSIRVTYVDHRFETDEINECNNTTAWVTFQVLPVNLEARVAPRTVVSGTSIATTSFTYRNIGSMTSPIFTYRILMNGVQVGAGSSTASVPVSTTWSNIVVPISWTVPTVAATQTIPYTVEITDPTNGIEASSTVITISPPPPPVPRLISCPTTVSVGIGGTANLTARYWANLAGAPTCSTGGYTDVTNTANWTSANTTIATVTNTGTRGMATGVSLGTTTVTAAYSSLSSPVTVGVSSSSVPISISLTTLSQVVRYNSRAPLSLDINANVNLSCTATGTDVSPTVFTHTGTTSTTTYSSLQTRQLTASQRVSVECINPLNPANRAEGSLNIEVVPNVQEI